MEHTWNKLHVKLSTTTLQTVAELGFTNMTPVQAACIPLALQYKDVAAEAVTGSGKTLAFVVPIVEIMLRRKEKWKKSEIGALIITPTQELAIQTSEVVSKFLERLPQFTQLLLIGGKEPKRDVKKFQSNGGNIIVATPGRLHHLLTTMITENLAAGLRSLEMLILDEADMLLAMGFKKQIDVILNYIPKQRRTGLFSATQTKQVKELIRAGLRNPVYIVVKEKSVTPGIIQKTPHTLKNFYMICKPDDKLNTLMTLLRGWAKLKIMIFFSTSACVTYFAHIIKELIKDTPVLGIFSQMKDRRHSVFDTFRKLEEGILICTDIMARGVDIPMVHWVVQYDPPTSASAFVHRCGRTARAGNHGNALIMLSPAEDTYVKFLEMNQKVVINEMQPPNDVVDILPEVRKMLLGDRAVFDMSILAFVSHIRAYDRHECSMLFRVKDLDFNALVTGYGLIKVPRMPELKGKDISLPEQLLEDERALAYKDEKKEKERQEKLAIYDETGQWPGRKPLPRKKEARRKRKEMAAELKERKAKRARRRIAKRSRKEPKKIDVTGIMHALATSQTLQAVG